VKSNFSEAQQVRGVEKMFKTLFVCVFCATLFLISGCVSKLQYLELEEEFYISQQQLEQQKKGLYILNKKLLDLEANRKKNDKAMLDFRAKNKLLIKRNARLLRKIRSLERIISIKQPKGGFELKW